MTVWDLITITSILWIWWNVTRPWMGGGWLVFGALFTLFTVWLRFFAGLPGT